MNFFLEDITIFQFFLDLFYEYLVQVIRTLTVHLFSRRYRRLHDIITLKKDSCAAVL